MSFRSRYGVPDPDNRNDWDNSGGEPSMTKQSEAYESDINVIMSRYIETGDASIFNQRVGQFVDVSEIGDYQSCVELVRAAEAAFGTLPALTRDAFGNDPNELVAALSDPEQKKRLQELGIFVPEIVEAPPKPPVAPQQ